MTMLVRGKRELAVTSLHLFPILILLLVGGLVVIGVGFISLIRSDHNPDNVRKRPATQIVIAGLLVLSFLAFVLLILTTVL
jgi:uncharacterized membrane protein YidH (DUF202 family)